MHLMRLPACANSASFELDRMLDESAILRFRRLLEQHNLAQQVFATVNRQLAVQNLFLKQGDR